METHPYNASRSSVTLRLFWSGLISGRPCSAGRRKPAPQDTDEERAKLAAEQTLSTLLQQYAFVREEEEMVRMLRMLLVRQCAGGETWGAAEEAAWAGFTLAAEDVATYDLEVRNPL